MEKAGFLEKKVIMESKWCTEISFVGSRSGSCVEQACIVYMRSDCDHLVCVLKCAVHDAATENRKATALCIATEEPVLPSPNLV